MTKAKSVVTGMAVALVLVLSIGVPVLAASTSRDFTYGGMTVHCVLNANFGTSPNGYAKTYVDGASNPYLLRSYIFGYDSNGLAIKSANNLEFNYAQTNTIYCNAVKFMSQHEVVNSNAAVLEYDRLTLEK